MTPPSRSPSHSLLHFDPAAGIGLECGASRAMLRLAVATTALHRYFFQRCLTCVTPPPRSSVQRAWRFDARSVHICTEQYPTYRCSPV